MPLHEEDDATVSWQRVRETDPDFADQVERRFNKYKHKVLATLRKDGSPRISGIEAEFRDGELRLGMMPGSLKARDVQRDGRIALHSGTEDPPDAPSPGDVFDAKLSGIAVEVTDDAPKEGGPPAHHLRIDVHEVVLVSLGDTGDHLLIKTWTPNRGLREVKRY